MVGYYRVKMKTPSELKKKTKTMIYKIPKSLAASLSH